MLRVFGVLTLLLFLIICEDVIPATLPEFQNAYLTRTSDQFFITTSQRKIQLVNVPDVMQATTYTCGPSSMQAVLAYYQFHATESQVMQASGTIPNTGTGPIMLENGFHKLTSSMGQRLSSLEYIRVENMTMEELESEVESGQPVIVLLQVFKPANDSRPYSQFNDRGHYMVIIGMDEERFYFQDPKLLNNVMYIPKDEFETRWHDHLSSQKRIVSHVGIKIRLKDGSKPQGSSKLDYLLD